MINRIASQNRITLPVRLSLSALSMGAVLICAAMTVLLLMRIGQYVPEQVLSFQTGAKQNENIYLLETGRNFLRPLTFFSDVSIDSYEWHPGGDSLILSARNLETPSYNLYRLSVHGELQRLNSDETTWDLNPRWSPDGTKIAFVSSRGSGLKLYVMDADGGNLRLLSRTQVDALNFDWSPDSTTIAAVPRDGIVLIDLSGASITTRRLVNLPGFESAPRWSADGRDITFFLKKGVYYHIDPVSGTAHQVEIKTPDSNLNPLLSKLVAQVYQPKTAGEIAFQKDVPVIRPSSFK